MKKTAKKEFQPGHGYSKKDWSDVSDNPSWTKEGMATAVPFEKAFPDLAKTVKRGRPPVESPKEAVTLRVDPETVKRWKATGKGWRSRMSEALEGVEPKAA